MKPLNKIIQELSDGVIKADQFLMAAAGLGQFLKQAAFGEYLKQASSLIQELKDGNWFEERPYIIRHPYLEDLPALVRLETECWAEPLRASEAEIEARIKQFPTGHCVQVMDDQVVGVIYSQRITDVEALDKTDFRQVASLHTPDGSIVQFIAVNVLPEKQQYGLGDQLLEFMLQYSSVKHGVERVVGVSPCKNYIDHHDIPMETYLQKRNDRGQVLDPILRFHERHGATIEKILQEYRPEDIDNKGAGVLISYNIQQYYITRSDSDSQNINISGKQDIATVVEQSIRQLIGEEEQVNFSPECSLMELDVNSLEIMELSESLNEQLDADLDPTFFFRYNHIEDIINRLEELLSVTTETVKPTSEELYFSATTVSENTISESPYQSYLHQIADRFSEPTSSKQDDFVAIIGLACRFPGGANSPANYWSLLQDGVDAITEVPPDRWHNDDYYDSDRSKSGKIVTRFGGFIDQVDQFDPQFFSISPREATFTDPQQRILLELAWQALEHAGIDPSSLVGSQTGVFTGIFAHDYELLQVKHNPSQAFEVYYSTGNSSSVAAGRLAYVFGFQGPAISVDTACSSSLVAVHLATQSLLRGETDLALATGVHLILSPELSITFSKAGMLSPDGRCKTFDAAANGYVRGEGGGIVVLKRLSQAIADGDKIWAVIRGTAINQDGASNGLTAPNGLSQEAVIRQALETAGVAPHEVSYVEAHGTGTSLGDPIEIKSLENVYGQDRDADNPLLIGSVKTNIGHLESAAGIAGLIKVVLSMQHEYIPAHLHFKQANPLIELDRIPAIIPKDGQSWQPVATPERLIAGISSFGFSGTNAHVILEKSVVQDSSAQAEGGIHLLTLSAKSETALKDLAQSYVDYLSDSPERSLQTDRDVCVPSLSDICYTSHIGRAHFDYRLALVADSKAGLREQLTSIDSEGIKRISRQVPKVAFLFTGQGAQYVNMGRQLYDSQPVFRETFNKCAEILQPLLETPLLDVVYPKLSTNNQPSKINQTAYTQPALFALEYSLAKLWQSWGIEPSAVIGHSVGEYVAACIAGVFSLEDGLKLIAKRGSLMQSLPQDGDMIVAFSDEDTITTAIEPFSEKVSIAGINGPRIIVISGEREAINQIIDKLKANKIKTTKLKVSHAFHSPLMEPMLAEFEQTAAKIKFSAPQITLISNVTGKVATDEITTPKYWCHHVRQAVRFKDGMETLHEQGYDLFLEAGPRPTLIGMGRQCVPDPDGTSWLPSLRPGQPDQQLLLQSLAELYVLGLPIDWSAFHAIPIDRRTVLPTYPFQRQRYWIDTSSTPQLIKPRHGYHPLLGQRINSALKDVLFESQISSNSPAYLKEHCIYQQAVLPASAYLEMALTAAAAVFKSDNIVVEDFIIHQALILPQDEIQSVQLILSPDDDQSFQIFSQPITGEDEEPSWTCYASGKLQLQTEEAILHQVDLLSMTQNKEAYSVTDFYQHRHERGIDYGPVFQGLQQLWKRENQVVAQIQLPQQLVSEVEDYKLHPVLLDICFQVGVATLPELPEDETFLTIGLERLQIYHQPLAKLWCRAQLRSVDNIQAPIVDLDLFDEAGLVVAKAEGLSFNRANRQVLLATIGSRDKSWQEWLYEVNWLPQVVYGRSLDFLQSPEKLHTNLQPQLGQFKVQLAPYNELTTNIETLCVGYILAAFKQMGWQWQSGQCFSTEQIIEQLGIVDQFHKLLGRLLEILAEEDIVKHVDEIWEVSDKLPKSTPQVKQLWSTLIDQYPAAKAELTLLGRCGDNLAEVLQGECNPLQLLFPEADVTTATSLYQDSPAFGIMNSLVQKLFSNILTYLPKSQGIRILEIGAGTGGTTAHILPHLPNQQVEYTFTDIGTLFINKAQERFKDYPFIEYKVLDIEQDPLAQDFASEQYDLIIAANVIHATTNLQLTLQHVHKLLSPKGMLVLLEGTVKRRWIDLIFGLMEGWWRFADHELRPDYPLMSNENWSQLLLANDFKEVVALSPDSEEKSLFPQSIIVAQKMEKPITTEQAKHWLILVSNNEGTGQQLANLLEARGQVCTLVFSGSIYKQLDTHRFEIDSTNSADYDRLLQNISVAEQPLHGVIHLWSLDIGEPLKATDLDIANQRGCGTTLYLVQSLLRQFSSPPSLWLVTQGAQPVENLCPAVAQSPLWGMGKVIGLEHPDLNCVLIDLDPTQDDPQVILEEILYPEIEENQVAFRNQVRYVARMVRHETRSISDSVVLRKDNTYLVTGGLGALGLHVAHWLVEQGAKHVVLTGRSGATSKIAKEGVEQLEQLGANVLVAKVDVSSELDMAKIFTEIKDSMPPLKGVIHAAGVVEYETVKNITFDSFRLIARPKVLGTWILHQLTRELTLDFFVGFSSGSSVWGAMEQGHYAAANQFIDGMIHFRHSEGLPALSINWGAWAGGGMTKGEFKDQLLQMGFNLMSPEQSLVALDYLIKSNSVQVTVANIDWLRFRSIYEARKKRVFLELIEGQSQETVEQLSNQPSDFRQQLIESVNPQVLLQEHVSFQVAKVLGLNQIEPIDSQLGFFELGMDSLTSVELRNLLQNSLNCSLPPVVTFDYPTIETLVDYILKEVLVEQVVDKPHIEEVAFSSLGVDEDEEDTEEIAKQFAEQLGMSWEEIDE